MHADVAYIACFMSMTRFCTRQVREALGVRRTIISGGGSLAGHLDDFFEVSCLGTGSYPSCHYAMALQLSAVLLLLIGKEQQKEQSAFTPYILEVPARTILKYRLLVGYTVVDHQQRVVHLVHNLLHGMFLAAGHWSPRAQRVGPD
jgi:hypothetical protein